MLAVCLILVYFSVLLIEHVDVSGGFNFASVKTSLFYFKKLHSSFLSPSSVKAIEWYQVNVSIKALNLPECILASFRKLLIPLFSRFKSCKILAGKIYAYLDPKAGKNIRPLLVYTMRPNCNIKKNQNWT